MRDRVRGDADESAAELLFAAWLAGPPSSDIEEFEKACADHPDLAPQLRDLRATWESVRATLGCGNAPGPSEAQPADSLEELRSRAASSNDPLNRYRVERELGSGAMGSVVEVWDGHLERALAMKTSQPSDKAEPRRLARMLQEAKLTARLDHPGIVPVHDLGIDASGRLWFTMKLVRGESLQRVMDARAKGACDWTLARFLEVLVRVCDAMSYAHDAGIVHRDLKPANVMLGRYGEVYVMDWGLARVLDALDGPTAEPAGPAATVDHPALTHDGDILGTPLYMSPEQAAGRRPDVGRRSDVYSIGAVLYHWLAGHPPYAETGGRMSSREVWRAVRDGPPTPIAEAAPDAPPELLAICEHAMAAEPSARYADMNALAMDLRAYLEQRVVAAYDTSAWALARSWIRRHRGLAAGLAGSVALIIASGITATLLFLRAEDQRLRAERGERELGAQSRALLGLSDQQVHRELVEEAARLWPPHPELIPAFEHWIERARQLASRLPEHRARRDALAQGQLDGAPSVAPIASGGEVRWWLAQLERLIESVEALESASSGLLGSAADAVSPGHGWSVPRRLAFARALQRDGLPGGPHESRWRVALPQLREAHPGVQWKPQIGLVPIGRDPDSGLWEFWHVATGREPERDERGRIHPSADDGVVLVFLERGEFLMGSVAGASSADSEWPVRRASTDAFFIGKFEVTQGQWLRLTGANPSYHQEASVGGSHLLHPVEGVSWTDALSVLRRAGLDLPTEARWERAARGGADSRWWCGTTGDSVREQRAANLMDLSLLRSGQRYGQLDWPDWDDGWANHAPVGVFAPNPFGVHDVLGNVSEWCLDGYSSAPPDVSHEPYVPWEHADERVSRGGSFINGVEFATCSTRVRDLPRFVDHYVGVRAARKLD